MKHDISHQEESLKIFQESFLTASNTQSNAQDLQGKIAETKNALVRLNTKLTELDNQRNNLLLEIEAKKQENEREQTKRIAKSNNINLLLKNVPKAQIGLINAVNSSQYPIHSKVKRLIEKLNNSIAELIKIDENHDENILTNYQTILKTVQNALPNAQGQIDQNQISDLKNFAKQINSHKYHPNTGLRQLAGIMLMVAGSLSLLISVCTGITPSGVVFATAGVYSIKSGYGRFNYGSERYPDATIIDDLAINLEGLKPG